MHSMCERGRQRGVGRMLALWVVEQLDVIKPISPRCFPCPVFPASDLHPLQEMKEALDNSVVRCPVSHICDVLPGGGQAHGKAILPKGGHPSPVWRIDRDLMIQRVVEHDRWLAAIDARLLLLTDLRLNACKPGQTCQTVL